MNDYELNSSFKGAWVQMRTGLTVCRCVWWHRRPVTFNPNCKDCVGYGTPPIPLTELS
jgi:hypothetical protein